MTDRKEGLTAAIEALGGAGEPPAAEVDQAELFEAEAPLPMPPAKGVSGPKGGRPKGARNRRTQEWVEYLLSRYRSPLVFLLETYHRSPRELAEQLELYKYHEGKLVLAPVLDVNGVHLRDAEGALRWKPALATGDAAEIQVRAAIAALPYLHQKQPLAVEIQDEKRGLLVIGNLTIEGADGAGGDLALPLAETIEDQALIEHEPEQSDSDKSDETGK
ncbi:MAG: hypothetical protein WCZ28_06050 [Burkholderiaceae bacterium]